MTKISLLPDQPTPTTADRIPVVSGGQTVRETISVLIALFFANIPTGNASPTTRSDETQMDHVASGGVWTGDNYNVNRNASMTAAVIYLNGRRLAISAVTARTFTASRDTYIDVLDNLDGTGTLVYTEVTNNNASPALAANSVRIGIIVTGASAIVSVASINQGQETKVLPIASSIPYAVTDSLGNLICNRDADAELIGYRQNVSNFTTSSTSAVDFTELNFSCDIPAGRKIKLIIDAPQNYNGGGGTNRWDFADVTAGTTVYSPHQNVGNTVADGWHQEFVYTPPVSGKRNFKARVNVSAGTYNSAGAAASPVSFRAELY